MRGSIPAGSNFIAMVHLNIHCIHEVARFCKDPSQWCNVHGIPITGTPAFQRVALSCHRRLFSRVLQGISRAALEWYVPQVRGNPFWPKADEMANLVITPVRADQYSASLPTRNEKGENLVLVEYERRGLFCADRTRPHGVEGVINWAVVAYQEKV